MGNIFNNTFKFRYLQERALRLARHPLPAAELSRRVDELRRTHDRGRGLAVLRGRRRRQRQSRQCRCQQCWRPAADRGRPDEVASPRAADDRLAADVLPAAVGQGCPARHPVRQLQDQGHQWNEVH